MTALSTFFFICGIPFFTATTTTSPIPIEGVLVLLVWLPLTPIIWTIFAPLLSSHVMNEPIVRPPVILLCKPFISTTPLGFLRNLNNTPCLCPAQLPALRNLHCIPFLGAYAVRVVCSYP